MKSMWNEPDARHIRQRVGALQPDAAAVASAVTVRPATPDDAEGVVAVLGSGGDRPLGNRWRP